MKQTPTLCIKVLYEAVKSAHMYTRQFTCY